MPAPSEPRAEFRTTRWSLVERVRSTDPAASRAALEELFRAYWPALYAFARRLGEAPESAADLVQGYATELLERADLAALERDGGRLRAWLKTGLRHHRSHVRERAAAHKRGGAWLAIDLAAAEAELGARADADSDPERAFDRAFGEALLARAFARLAEEHADGPRRALLAFLTAAPDDDQRTELERASGMSAGALRVALHRLRRRYAELVRDEVADGCANPAAVQSELLELRLSFDAAAAISAQPAFPPERV
ncbi:MAG: sigma-70 family RNA polymerase sigma factor [Planctomycetota bacterium]|nr:MAG: sigma-70 family RNA polymerase sigma factor [Planctomycetota bacterium]